jgi:hypothetical protein
MRVRALPVLFALALGVGALAAAAAEPATSGVTRLGRYELVHRGELLEIRTPRESRLAVVIGGSGFLLAGLALFVGAAGRRGSAIALAVVGVGLAAAGGAALLRSSRWLASPVELVRERGGGRIERWRHAEIALVEVRRRPRGVEDMKETRLRPTEVRVRRQDGSRIVRFKLDAERDARALARELAGALRVEVREE